MKYSEINARHLPLGEFVPAKPEIISVSFMWIDNKNKIVKHSEGELLEIGSGSKSRIKLTTPYKNRKIGSIISVKTNDLKFL